jgi:hypothetical protein
MRTTRSQGSFQEVIRIKPDDTDARKSLAKVLELKNKPDVPASGPIKP